MQVSDPLCSANEPLLQTNVAEPVVGAVASVTGTLLPAAVAAAVALQLLLPTAQFTVVLGHDGGGGGAATLQVLAACWAVVCAKVPLSQMNAAEPVVGAVPSDTVAVPPVAVLTSVPLQVLPATVQLTGAVAQDAGGAAEQDPLR